VLLVPSAWRARVHGRRWPPRCAIPCWGSTQIITFTASSSIASDGAAVGTPDFGSSCVAPLSPHLGEIPAGQQLVRKPDGQAAGRHIESQPTETSDATDHPPRRGGYSIRHVWLRLGLGPVSVRTESRRDRQLGSRESAERRSRVCSDFGVARSGALFCVADPGVVQDPAGPMRQVECARSIASRSRSRCPA
jgi:hypothetical protein